MHRINDVRIDFLGLGSACGGGSGARDQSFQDFPLTLPSPARGEGSGDYGRIAMIRTGPPVPPLIFIGKAMMVAPFGGSVSKLAMFSSP